MESGSSNSAGPSAAKSQEESVLIGSLVRTSSSRRVIALVTSLAFAFVLALALALAPALALALAVNVLAELLFRLRSLDAKFRQFTGEVYGHGSGKALAVIFVAQQQPNQNRDRT